ncbi:hypothetical protein CXB51_010528 [Gossypium anomalum]|uniref:Uncharacterized protein n=1 Tax=Gossypium anomalum TaxID=47600 RepID=A0A8J6D289_9ROSI|nr:hypothetical protein CXB51_010528 [Gossypium anomalum]
MFITQICIFYSQDILYQILLMLYLMTSNLSNPNLTSKDWLFNSMLLDNLERKKRFLFLLGDDKQLIVPKVRIEVGMHLPLRASSKSFSRESNQLVIWIKGLFHLILNTKKLIKTLDATWA